MTVERERNNHAVWRKQHDYLADRRMVLITGHRRENFGGGFRQICQAIKQLALDFPDVSFVYPVHLNPNVAEPARQMLTAVPNVHLIEPVPYPEFVWLMDRCTLILSDSGGVQEEAPSLKKPVLVMRDTTERPEALDAGAIELVGTNTDRLHAAAVRLLTDPRAYVARQVAKNPYGDGKSAPRIANRLLCQFHD